MILMQVYDYAMSTDNIFHVYVISRYPQINAAKYLKINALLDEHSVMYKLQQCFLFPFLNASINQKRLHFLTKSINSNDQHKLQRNLLMFNNLKT